jgi:PLD-like domain
MDDSGEAQRIVGAVYGVLDLFSSSESDLLAWSKELRADEPADDLLPGFFSIDSQAALTRHLATAGVVNDAGEVDPYALRGFQRVIELLPHFRAEEAAHVPSPGPQVVLTVPREVELPAEARHLQRSLAARVSDALISATRRVLLASPYWSEPGNEILLPLLTAATTLGLPITLAGARREDVEHHAAMLALGEALADAGCQLETLTFVPPKPNSLFHAKIVAGQLGYLGSANLTASGLGEHVEVGVPLSEPDVERVWWLIDVLKKSELLVAA